MPKHDVDSLLDELDELLEELDALDEDELDDDELLDELDEELDELEEKLDEELAEDELDELLGGLQQHSIDAGSGIMDSSHLLSKCLHSATRKRPQS